MISLQIERFADVYEEVSPLLIRHWQEIARNKDKIVYAPDEEKYKRLDDAGAMMIVTARDGGSIVGYAVYFISGHLHYKNDKWALSDIFWIAPEYRGKSIGIRLFQRVEQELRNREVSVMHTTSKVAHPQAQRLLEHMGHTLIEYGHAKTIKGT